MKGKVTKRGEHTERTRQRKEEEKDRQREREMNIPSTGSFSIWLSLDRAKARSSTWVSRMDGKGPNTWSIFPLLSEEGWQEAGLEVKQLGFEPVLQYWMESQELATPQY